MAQNGRHTLGGPRYNKPHEVHDLLNTLGRNYNQLYDEIMRHAVITWDLDSNEVWVEGSFRSTKSRMIRWTGLSKSMFYIKWRKLIDADLIRVEDDGLWVLTMIIRKANISISPAEVRRMQLEQIGLVEKLQKMQRNFEILAAEMVKMKAEKGTPEEQIPVSRTKNGRPVVIKESGPPDKKGSLPDKKGSLPDTDNLILSLKEKNSLSNVNIVVTNFFRLTGQGKISSTKRERAFAVAKKLEADGFSLEDIAFAVEWTIENTEKEVYDFGLIAHTIGQALAARDKVKTGEEEREEHDKVLEEERLKFEREKIERQEIETRKANLNQEERKELREDAREKLLVVGLGPTIVTDFLLEIKENEILREKGGKAEKAAASGAKE